MTTITPVPAGSSGDQLIQVLNNRFNAIAVAINGLGGNPQITGNLNLGGNRIVNLGDAVNPTDALNVRTGDKRYAAINQSINQPMESVLVVGNNGSGNPVKLEVFDHKGNLIGWIGDDTGGSGYVGGWFQQLRVGGANPAAAPLFCDAAGDFFLQIGTTDTLYIDATNIWKIVDSVNLQYVQYTGGALQVALTTPPGGTSIGPSTIVVTGVSNQAIHIQAGGGGANIIMFDSGSNQSVNLNGSNVLTASLKLGSSQVVTVRQAGPGVPSFATLANAQTWCQNLLTALQTHGLVS